MHNHKFGEFRKEKYKVTQILLNMTTLDIMAHIHLVFFLIFPTLNRKYYLFLSIHVVSDHTLFFSLMCLRRHVH